MRLAILSRNKKLYSIRRLKEEALSLGVDCVLYDPLQCQLILEGKKTSILYGREEITGVDVLLPRIGASITAYGLSVVRHFEMQKVEVVNGSDAIGESRNKFKSLQILAKAGLQVPSTVLAHTTPSLKKSVQAVRGFPVVLKILQGTQGVGVMLVHSPVSLGSVLDTLRALNQDVLIQEFLTEGAGHDYRVFIIDQKVVGAMQRTARSGEFRSNIHQGGKGNPIRLDQRYESLALRAARAFNLEIAGVDLMDGPHGPMVIEVNSSPGFEGLEKSTGKNIAREIMRYIKKKRREK